MQNFFAEYSLGYSGSLTSSLVTHLVTMSSSVVFIHKSDINWVKMLSRVVKQLAENVLHYVKTCLWGFRPGLT